MSSLRVFIGWDSRIQEPGLVLAHTLRKHSSVPLDIRFLDLRHLQDCYGFSREHDPLASTEFTYSRFLVPWLCDYTGTALFLDNDMVCLSDIAELHCYSPACALHVVKHDHQVQDGSKKMYGAVQTSYPRKNWSSMMLMNCARLRLWSKHAVETKSGAYLHRFEGIPDGEIGSLNPRWNDLDNWQSDTKIIHYTSGGPWYLEYAKCQFAEVWYAAREDRLRSLSHG